MGPAFGRGTDNFKRSLDNSISNLELKEEEFSNIYKNNFDFTHSVSVHFSCFISTVLLVL